MLLNQGDGTFAAAVAYAAGNRPQSVAVGDLDGVNGPDLAVANLYSDDVSVLLNEGDGTFAAPVAYATGTDRGPWPSRRTVPTSPRRAVEVAEPATWTAWRNGRVQRRFVAVGGRGSDDVSVLLNQGDGTFAAAVAYGAGASPRGRGHRHDLDGANGPDLAVANPDSVEFSPVSVLLNLCTTRTLSVGLPE